MTKKKLFKGYYDMDDKSVAILANMQNYKLADAISKDIELIFGNSDKKAVYYINEANKRRINRELSSLPLIEDSLS